MPYKKVVCPSCGINKIIPISLSCRSCWRAAFYTSTKIHHSYKGDKACYTSLHIWLGRRKPRPLRCELCGEIKKTELVLKGRKYTRDVNDYWHLCRKCHMMIDGRLEMAIKRASKYRMSIRNRISNMSTGG